MAFQMFKWVDHDGIYDHKEFLVRYHIVHGNPHVVISKMWLDAGGPADVSQEYLLPWGSYPDLPPKPPKK